MKNSESQKSHAKNRFKPPSGKIKTRHIAFVSLSSRSGFIFHTGSERRARADSDAVCGVGRSSWFRLFRVVWGVSPTFTPKSRYRFRFSPKTISCRHHHALMKSCSKVIWGILALPVVYVLSSGPAMFLYYTPLMRTVIVIYTPLTYLANHTFASRVLVPYWDLWMALVKTEACPWMPA